MNYNVNEYTVFIPEKKNEMKEKRERNSKLTRTKTANYIFQLILMMPLQIKCFECRNKFCSCCCQLK